MKISEKRVKTAKIGFLSANMHMQTRICVHRGYTRVRKLDHALV